MKKITINNNEITIQFQAKSKEEFHDILSAVKTIPGRKFIGTEKVWRCPKSEFAFNILKLSGFPLPDDSKPITTITKKEAIEPITPEGLKRGLWEFQKTGIGFVESRNGRAIIADEMRLGKGHPEFTKILTPTGWEKLKHIKVGDKIIGSNGKPTIVNGIFKRGKLPTYRIRFNDKTSILTDIDHLWAVKTCVQKWRNNPYITKSTKELKEKTAYKNGNFIWSIPLVKPIHFTKKKYIIHPYIFGVILGDGGISQHTLNISPYNNKITSEIKKYLPQPLKLSSTKNNFDEFRIIKRKKDSKQNIFIKELKKLKLMGLKSTQKFIPKQYLFSSIKNRILLLQGLMDTDSYQGLKDGHLEYYTSSKQLSQDISFLIQSLGGTAKKRIKKNPKYKYKGKIKFGKTSYTLTINLPQNINPYKAFFKDYVFKTKYFPNRMIHSIKKEGNQNIICLSVDSIDNLYVAENCIVTHNTVQALGWLQLRPDENPILIICDASAKLVWAQMIKDWLPTDNKIQIIEGRSNNNIIKDVRFIIVNYESLYQAHICDICEGRKIVFGRRCLKCKGKGKVAQLREDISNFSFFAMIVDEAQKIRNINTYYTKIILELGKKINHIIATTGTPIENRPEEFYNIISLIDPSLFPTRWDFRKRYCGLYHDGFGWKYNGATNTTELHKILTNTIMIRRLRKEVEKDTPEKVRPLVPIEFDENCRSEYRITSKTVAEMESGSSNVLAEFEHLKQIAVQGKMKGVIKWIEEFLEEGDQKLILFAVHKKVLNILHTYFKDISVVLDGSTSSKINKDGSNERKRVENEFQTNPKIRLFIGNIQAAGRAICLDAANDVAFIEFSFVPGHHLQAEDRPIHMRKKGGCIYAWYLIAKDTIEEDIFKVLDKKCKVLGQILDGKDTEEESIFGELLGKLKEREKHEKANNKIFTKNS